VRGKGSPPKKRARHGIQLKLPYKALSTNKIYGGRKHRSVYYKRFRKDVLGYLSREYDGRSVALCGNLQLYMKVGVSSPLSDLSNCLKAIEDCVMEWLNKQGVKVDDRQFVRILLEKRLVNKGSEYMNLELKKYRKNIDRRYKR